MFPLECLVQLYGVLVCKRVSVCMYGGCACEPQLEKKEKIQTEPGDKKKCSFKKQIFISTVSALQQSTQILHKLSFRACFVA